MCEWCGPARAPLAWWLCLCRTDRERERSLKRIFTRFHAGEILCWASRRKTAHNFFSLMNYNQITLWLWTHIYRSNDVRRRSHLSTFLTMWFWETWMTAHAGRAKAADKRLLHVAKQQLLTAPDSFREIKIKLRKYLHSGQRQLLQRRAKTTF